MGERLNGIQEVRSSILLISTKVAFTAAFFIDILRILENLGAAVTKRCLSSVIID